MKNSDPKSSPAMRGGSRLTLHRQHQTSRLPVQVTVDRVEGNRIWVKSSSGGVGLGGTVLLEYMMEDDCRYLAQGEIETQSPEACVIVSNGEWRRVQDRSFVRITTHGIEVELPDRASPSPDETATELQRKDCDGRFEMLDVSAGGLRFEANEGFAFNEEFVCHFELPGNSPYRLPARVVRSQTKPGRRDRYRVAVEFVDLSEAHRSELLQWIYHEQSRRHNSKRQMQ